MVLILVAAFFYLPASPSKYLGALADKDALLRQAASPKMVVVGGSNLAFGLDSGHLEEVLGYDVVNMGLHSGLGLRYMLNQVEPHLASGDVVVLSLEYHLLHGKGSDQALPEALNEFPAGIEYLTFQDGLRAGPLLLALQKRAQRFVGFLQEPNDPVYHRRAFDNNGDLTAHLSESGQEFGHTYESFEKPVAASATALLNAFEQRARRRGAQVVLSFPPFPEAYASSEHPAWLDALRGATSIPVVSDPSRSFFPKTMFFDTCYHLNAEGRRIRSLRLAEDLAEVL